MEWEERPELKKLARIAELISKRLGPGLSEPEERELQALQEEVEGEGRGSNRGPLALMD